MTTLNKQMHTCSCGHIHQVNERVISMYAGLITALWHVVRWCEEKRVHEFQTKSVKHLLGKNEYARFGDWVFFGGLVYKHGKALYGLHLPRCHDFFAGKSQIPRVVYKNPMTRQITPGELCYIHQFPNLIAFLDANEQYIAIYREPQGSFL